MREVETWEIHAYTPHIIETARAWLLQLDILDSGFLSHLSIYLLEISLIFKCFLNQFFNENSFFF